MYYSKIPGHKRNKLEAALALTVEMIEQRWFNSSTDLITERNRLLCRLRLVVHGRMLASGPADLLPSRKSSRPTRTPAFGTATSRYKRNLIAARIAHQRIPQPRSGVVRSRKECFEAATEILPYLRANQRPNGAALTHANVCVIFPPRRYIFPLKFPIAPQTGHTRYGNCITMLCYIQ